jgi:4-carboxymuconolactone decarboxylase
MDKAVFDKGLAIRKSVIGAEFVDKAFAAADDFNMPLQNLVTEFCWGAVWGREALEPRLRSIINLAMIAVLNRPHELEVHLRGALRNGVTEEEIREILLQVVPYGGFPAAIDAFRIATAVLREEQSKK